MEYYNINIAYASYTFTQLMKIAGFEDKLINSFKCKFDDDFIIFKSDKLSIKFYNSKDNTIKKILDGKINFNKTKSFDNKRDIPVILKQKKSFFEFDEDTIIINAEIIPLSFILLSRLEEIICNERDLFGRFEYVSSISFKYDLIDIPIVDEYSLLLKVIIKKKTNFTTNDLNRGKFILTQDLDYIYRFSNIFKSTVAIILIYLLVILFFQD